MPARRCSPGAHSIRHMETTPRTPEPEGRSAGLHSPPQSADGKSPSPFAQLQSKHSCSPHSDILLRLDGPVVECPALPRRVNKTHPQQIVLGAIVYNDMGQRPSVWRIDRNGRVKLDHCVAFSAIN